MVFQGQCSVPASVMLYIVIIAPLQEITLPCYEYEESQGETAKKKGRGVGTSVDKDDSSYSRLMTKC